MKKYLTTTAVLSAAALSLSSATARPVSDSQMKEMVDVVSSDATDSATRLRLAGILSQMGYEAEATAIMKEVAAIDAEIDIFIDGEGDCVGCERSVGPDVIVGDLNGLAYYGSVDSDPGAGFNWVHAFAIGTTSCNIGNQNLLWISNTNDHPVIGQTIYRIKNNVLDQIGQSWLKHGFFALSQNLCSGGGCQSTNGSSLGVNCSDPYTPSRNGTQGNLGPKYQVNATNGEFPYPPAGGSGVTSTLSRRINVADADMNPTQNPGAIYFGEAMYVQFQDAQFENNDNNSSWEQITWSNYFPAAGATGPSFSGITVLNPTKRMLNPIDAWKNFVPAVQKTNIVVTNDSSLSGNFYTGLMVLGTIVTQVNATTWNYSYALYNMNSHSSARSFSVPVPATATVSNPSFHDVHYHSGDGIGNVNYSGTDWNVNVSRGAGSIEWSTQTLAQNANANAIRWGTTYTFRFDADAPPTAANATVGLFQPIAQTSVDPAATQGPDCLLAWDLSGDDQVEFADLNLLLDGYGTTYDFADLNSLLDQYGDSCN